MMASSVRLGLVFLIAAVGCADSAELPQGLATALDSGRGDVDVVAPEVVEPSSGPVDAAPWLAAETFSVELNDDFCYGVCPRFRAGIDESGRVSYYGRGWVARPGFYEVDVPAESARALFVAMLDAGFLGMHDRYVDAADGCTELGIDGPTYTFAVRAGDFLKRVEMSDTCTPSAQAFSRRFEREIRRVTTVGRFLYPTPSFLTPRPPLNVRLKQSWVIERWTDDNVRSDVGILQVDAFDWNVKGCDEEVMASGDVFFGPVDEAVLLPPSAAPKSLAWPDVDEPQGVALLNYLAEPQINIRLLSLTDQHTQRARVGNVCDPTATRE